MKLLVATTNKGKQREILALFLDSGIEIVFPQDFPETATVAVAETGETFAENALLKAQAFGDITGLLTVADDSGLQVTALGGFPGVKSNRWHLGTDAERNQALLKKMESLEDRSAQFITAACIYNSSTKNTQYFEGTVQGIIGTEAKGVAGFGYDPLFIPNGYTGTFAELGEDIKNSLSHRAKAFNQVLQFLVTQR